jgi:hypothetical protein
MFWMRQESLFDEPLAAPVLAIPGFLLERDYVDEDEERALLAAVADGPWEDDWQRRIQQYGLGYGAAGPPTWVRDFPDWLRPLARRVFDDGHLDRFPENCVVNEYLPGRGIGAHSDYPAFGNRVACVSLGSDIVIDFAERAATTKVSLHVPARSLWVIAGPSRWQWTHAIAHRKSDVIDGMKVPRARRVSITFRTASEKNRARVPASVAG